MTKKKHKQSRFDDFEEYGDLVRFFGKPIQKVKEELEELAREDALKQTNMMQIADELDSLGFKTEISSEGGKDASDLLLKIRKV